MVTVSMKINGKNYSGEAEPRTLLVHFIRDTLRLKGTHIGCDTGHCGACTILWNGEPVKSCQILAVQAEGADLTTVEGLEPEEGKYSIEQESFREHFAMQCGYCTPGFLMMTRYLIRNNPEMTREEIREKLHGNYCMCTGYQQIVDAVQDAQKKFLISKK
ncbi:MAG: (2Fe-2S)-binding protein [Thermoplasmatales archaeon]|jgi:aerobic-type carbon monoxide dehydrogenase small subunit (CoxS/CutS family)|nr:(2Fe-2S)-binding protein [Thermoplasmatales archaeon]